MDGMLRVEGKGEGREESSNQSQDKWRGSRYLHYVVCTLEVVIVTCNYTTKYPPHYLTTDMDHTDLDLTGSKIYMYVRYVGCNCRMQYLLSACNYTDLYVVQCDKWGYNSDPIYWTSYRLISTM